MACRRRENSCVVDNERRARQLAGERANRLKTEALARRSGRKMSLEDVSSLLRRPVKELSLVVKADVAGSLEAIEDEIAKLPKARSRSTSSIAASVESMSPMRCSRCSNG